MEKKGAKYTLTSGIINLITGGFWLLISLVILLASDMILTETIKLMQELGEDTSFLTIDVILLIGGVFLAFAIAYIVLGVFSIILVNRKAEKYYQSKPGFITLAIIETLIAFIFIWFFGIYGAVLPVLCVVFRWITVYQIRKQEQTQLVGTVTEQNASNVVKEADIIVEENETSNTEEKE